MVHEKLPARWYRTAFSKLSPEHRDRQAGHPRQCRHGPRHQCQRLCDADVQQPDRDRLQSGSRRQTRRRATRNWSPGPRSTPSSSATTASRADVGRLLRHGLGLRRNAATPRSYEGPFEESQKPKGDGARQLKDFNQNATLTPGNAGTLDMLGRGEIAIGPVWVDMFYSWQADGRSARHEARAARPRHARPADALRHPGQGRQHGAGREVRRARDQPEGPGRRHRQEVQLVSRHRRQRQAELDQATWNKLFTDISPKDLATNGKTFPIAPISTRSSKPTKAGRQLSAIGFDRPAASPSPVGPVPGRAPAVGLALSCPRSWSSCCSSLSPRSSAVGAFQTGAAGLANFVKTLNSTAPTSSSRC